MFCEHNMRISKPNVSIQVVFVLLVALLLLHPAYTLAQKRNFVLVLDAGHGGRDPGAVGKISREKDITLSVVRKVGEMVNDNFPDIRVVYTRKTDIFVPLEERASIANNHHADLFISVHTNAAKSRAAYGAETYTLGLAKSQANLAVAMAENSVMMLEDDYKTRYQGFDPSSVDSYIMFEFMMDTYLDNSISFATDVQQQLTTRSRRHDRGVRQAGFWVLHRSACPSVLVELGFISNQQEELYMASERGQQEMAESIYSAFVKYKRTYDRKTGNGSPSTSSRTATPVKDPEPATRKADTPAASPQGGTTTANDDSATEGTRTAVPRTPQSPSGSTREPESIQQIAKQPDSGQVTVPVFKVQFKSSPTSLSTQSPAFKGLKNVDVHREGGLYKYTVGHETSYDEANRLKNEVRKKFPDAFVIAFLGDRKISINEALKYSN